MKIEFFNGSVYQIVGSDNVDALRGAGIKGAVFSEYAEQRPTAWEVIQPMVMATNGWALFNFTPKGHNHAYELWEMAKNIYLIKNITAPLIRQSKVHIIANK
jgi:hypothetical protein